MKILQVINAFYPCQIWGGPPQNTLLLSKQMQGRGHEVNILTNNILNYASRMSNQSFRSEWEGVPVTYLNAYWRGRKDNSMGFIWSPDLFAYRHLIREVDVIHIHGYRHFLFTCVGWLVQLYRKPYIVQARGSLPKTFGRSRLKNIYDQFAGQQILRQCSQAIALSKAEKQEYIEKGVPQDRVSIIMNTIDRSILKEIHDGKDFRQKYGISPKQKLILFLSRIHKKKGLDLLINAFAKLKIPDVKLCIVGPDEGFLSTAKQLVENLGVQDSVVFTGPIFGKDKFRAYRAADVYVLPTRGGEGLPTTVLEACISGTPVIVTRRTEVAEIIDGTAGIAVNYDVEQLKDALKLLLSNQILQENYRQGTSRVFAEHFALDHVMDDYEQLYLKLTGN